MDPAQVRELIFLNTSEEAGLFEAIWDLGSKFSESELWQSYQAAVAAILDFSERGWIELFVFRWMPVCQLAAGDGRAAAGRVIRGEELRVWSRIGPPERSSEPLTIRRGTEFAEEAVDVFRRLSLTDEAKRHLGDLLGEHDEEEDL